MDWQSIRIEFENGVSVNDLSKKYGVKSSTINGRITRQFWERKQSVKQTWTRDKYNLSRKELIDCVNVCIQYLTNGNEFEFVEYIKGAYPLKKLSYKTIGKIKTIARKRIQKRIEIDLDSGIKEYLVKLDNLYRKAIELDDLKTCLDVLKERAKLIDLYPIPKTKIELKNEFDIEKDMKEFTEQWMRLNSNEEPPPTLEEILKG
jgi:hypothetical protein